MYKHLGKQLFVSYKVKHTYTTQASNSVPTYIPKRD